jgi:hypothetical protein
MSWFPRPVGPRAALSDLAAFMRQRSREQVIGGALALLVTTIIVIEFLVDSKIGTAAPQQVVEVELYAPDRTDAEIIADQKKDQARRHAYQAEKRRQFQELENKLGMK